MSFETDPGNTWISHTFCTYSHLALVQTWHLVTLGTRSYSALGRTRHSVKLGTRSLSTWSSWHSVTHGTQSHSALGHLALGRLGTRSLDTQSHLALGPLGTQSTWHSVPTPSICSQRLVIGKRSTLQFPTTSNKVRTRKNSW